MNEELILQYFQEAVLNSINATVQSVFQDSQENCPYVTGNLQNSGSITEASPATGEFTIAYNSNGEAPYVNLIEEGGWVNSHNRTNSRTGTTYGVNGYNVEGKFFIRNAIENVLSGDLDQVIVNANQGSSGYYINI